MYSSKLYEKVIAMENDIMKYLNDEGSNRTIEDELEDINSNIHSKGFLCGFGTDEYETIKKCLECHGYDLPNFICLDIERNLLKYIPSKLNEHINEYSKYDLDEFFKEGIEIEFSEQPFVDRLIYSKLVPYELREGVPKDLNSVVSRIHNGLVDTNYLQRCNTMTSVLNLRMFSHGIAMNDYIRRLSNDVYEVRVRGNTYKFSNGVIVDFKDGSHILYGELTKESSSKIRLENELKQFSEKFDGEKFKRDINKVWRNIMNSEANKKRLSDDEKTIESVYGSMFNHLSAEMRTWKILQEVFGIYGEDTMKKIDEIYQGHVSGHLKEIKNAKDKKLLKNLSKSLSEIPGDGSLILFKDMKRIEIKEDIYTSFGKLGKGQSIVFNQYGIFVVGIDKSGQYKLSLRTLQECSLGIVETKAVEESHEESHEIAKNKSEKVVKDEPEEIDEEILEEIAKHESEEIAEKNESKDKTAENEFEEIDEEILEAIADEESKEKTAAQNESEEIAENPAKSTKKKPGKKNVKNTEEKATENDEKNDAENATEKPAEDDIVKQQPSETKIDDSNSDMKNEGKEVIKIVDAKSVEEIKEEILKEATEITNNQYDSLMRETDILIDEYPYVRAHNSYGSQCWWWSSLRCLIYYARGSVNDVILRNIGLYNIYKFKRENTKELLVIISFITNPIKDNLMEFTDNRPYIESSNIRNEYCIGNDKMGSANDVLAIASIVQFIAIGKGANDWEGKESIENVIKDSDFILVNIDDGHFYTYLKNHDKNEFTKYNQVTLHGLTKATYENISDIATDISREKFTNFFYKLYVSNDKFSEPPVKDNEAYVWNMSGGASNRSSNHHFKQHPLKSLKQFTMDLNMSIPSNLFSILMKKIFKIYSLRYTDTIFACRTLKELLMFILSIIPSVYTYGEYIRGTSSTTFYDIRYNDFIRKFIRAFSNGASKKPLDSNTQRIIEMYNSIDDFYESIRTIGKVFAD